MQCFLYEYNEYAKYHQTYIILLVVGPISGVVLAVSNEYRSEHHDLIVYNYREFINLSIFSYI